MSIRLSQPPRSYQRPAPLPVVTMRDLATFRASCAACRGRMVVNMPTIDAGWIACLHCGREMAEVRDTAPTQITREAFAGLTSSTRGRPPGLKNGVRCGQCGRCTACKMRALRARRKAAS